MCPDCEIFKNETKLLREQRDRIEKETQDQIAKLSKLSLTCKEDLAKREYILTVKISRYDILSQCSCFDLGIWLAKKFCKEFEAIRK